MTSTGKSLVEKLKERHEALKKIRSDYDRDCREVQKFVAPMLGRIDDDKKRRDQYSSMGGRWDYIVDPTPVRAHKIATNGITSGFTPSSRPWNKLLFMDDDLNKYGPAKQWLDILNERKDALLRRSNFYSASWSSNAEDTAFGNSCLCRQVDPVTGLRFQSLTWGEWWADRDSIGRVDTVFRSMSMSVRQAAERFGTRNLSRTARNLLDREPLATIEVIHAVQPREVRDSRRIDILNKRYESIYYESACDERDQVALRESGLDKFPYVVSGWPRVGSDVYATCCPGIEILPSSRELQQLKEDFLLAMQKQGDPPVVAPTSLLGYSIKKHPGGENYIDSMDGQKAGFGPLYQVNINVQHWMEQIGRTREDIMSGCYSDLFLMISALESQKSNVTATQIMEMKAEKLHQLGGFVDIQVDDKYDPIVSGVIDEILSDPTKYRIPPPPVELSDADYRIEYESFLSQAQKEPSARAIDDVVMFAGNIAPLNPEIMDVIDFDEAVRVRSQIRGVPAAIVRGIEQVQEIRAQRQQQQHVMEAAAGAQAVTQGIRDLGSVSTSEENPNMATDLMGLLMGSGPMQ